MLPMWRMGVDHGLLEDALEEMKLRFGVLMMGQPDRRQPVALVDIYKQIVSENLARISRRTRRTSCGAPLGRCLPAG